MITDLSEYDDFLTHILSTPSENEEVVAEEESLPSVYAALDNHLFKKNFAGLLNKFINREKGVLRMTEMEVNNEVNFIVETIGLKALYTSSLEFSNYENKAYVYAGRVIWKKYHLAKLDRAKKISIAMLINKAFEHAYFNTYYA